MPLRDHFRPPVNDTHSWDALFGMWPAMMVREVFETLPAGFRSAPLIKLECESNHYSSDADSLTPAAPTHTVEAELLEQDVYEVNIYDTELGRQLVAVIIFICPTNKDRPRSREVVLGKVTSLLQQGVSVSLVDLVTVRQANLYTELLMMLDHAAPAATPSLYAVTFRSRKPKRRRWLDAWYHPMTLGQPLPTLPIWLNEDLRVMLPLETSYEETCRVLGIP